MVELKKLLSPKRIIVAGVILIFVLVAVANLDPRIRERIEQENARVELQKQTGPTIYKIGEKFNLGNLTYSLNGIYQINVLGNEFVNKTTEGMYYIVEFTIENTGNSEKTITPSNDFIVIDDKGRAYKPDLMLSVYAGTMGFEPLAIIEKIPAGISRTGIIVFEMPKETKGQIKVKPGWFSGEALAELS